MHIKPEPSLNVKSHVVFNLHNYQLPYYSHILSVKMRRHTLLTALSLSQLAIAAFNSPIKVTAPGTVPSGASEIVDHAFASFSFPAHWLPDFAGRLLLELSKMILC
jgi:hypothetical protein